MPTRDDENEMTDQDLDQPATRRDLRALRGEVHELGTALRGEIGELGASLRGEMSALEGSLRADIRALDTKIDERTADLRRHFDVTAEQFKAEFKNLFDWTNSTTSGLGTRLDRVETTHEARLTSVELRVTRLERRRKSH